MRANDQTTKTRGCVRTRSIRALFLVLAPATVAGAPLKVFSAISPMFWLPIALTSLVLAFAGLRHRVGNTSLRIAATFAFLFWAASTIAEHPSNPGRGLVVLLGVVGFLAFTWPSERLRKLAAEERTHHPDQELLIASGVAALFGLDEWFLRLEPTAWESLSLAVAYAVPLGLAARRHSFHHGWERWMLSVATILGLLPAVSALSSVLGYSLYITPIGLISPLVMFGIVARRSAIRWITPTGAPSEPGLVDAILVHPSRVLVLSFIAICTLGTLMLALPVSSANSQALPWLDAAFTAVSATCVTGLSVVDTPTTFGAFGQLAVLVLIQVGGLGIMVFSAAAIVLLGKRMSLSHERAAVDIVGATSRAGLTLAIRGVLTVTLITEATAALLLFAAFLVRGDTVGQAAWRAVFTAISAFCNAGFALQSDSLVSYANNPFVLSVVGLTIIIGSMGPAVIAAVVGWKDPSTRTLHARLVLWTTAAFIVVPAILITAIEWNGTLAGMMWIDKIFNGLFQSVTLRTAGFNSIDLAQIHPATWTVMVLAMYVGGSPGSTAGGVKTTTIAVLLLAIVAVVRGSDRVEAFKREIPITTVMRATVVATLGVLGSCVALVAIQLTQQLELDVALFEVVSALATVGLSTGGTAALDEVGKLIIMMCMFAGRVGPLTLFVFLASNTRDDVRGYPEESVPIG